MMSSCVIVFITVQDATGTEFEDKEYKYYIESVSHEATLTTWQLNSM